tara:strand:- start:443 stop:1300 length:858 start_codon:yes stop_codon:yes gene_type:complete
MANSVVRNVNESREEEKLYDNIEKNIEEKEKAIGDELERMFEESGTYLPNPEADIFDRIIQRNMEPNVVDLREEQYKDLAPPLFDVDVRDITYEAPTELPMESEGIRSIGLERGGNAGIETLKQTTMQIQEKPASRSALVLKRILKQAGVENVDPTTVMKAMSVLKQVEEKEVDDLQLIPKEFRKIEQDKGFGITTLRDKTNQEKYLSEFLSQVTQDDLRFKQYDSLANPLFKNFDPLSSFTSFQDLKRMRTTTTDEEGNQIPFSGNVRPIIKEDGSVEVFDVGI